MAQQIISFIVNYYPELTILVVLILLTIGLCRFYFWRFKPLENQFKTHNEDMGSIKPLLNSIDCNVRILHNFLRSKHANDPMLDAIITSKSPLALTELGMELLEESMAKNNIERYLSNYIADIELLNPKTGLDVDAIGQDLFWKKSETEEFNSIKNFVYHHPKYKDISLDLATIIFVMSIYLRQKYYEKHPELPMGDEKTTESQPAIA
jgi:hypothetical protein